MVPFADGEVIVEEGDYYDYDDRYREGAYYGTSGDQGCDGCGSVKIPVASVELIPRLRLLQDFCLNQMSLKGTVNLKM